MRFRIRASLSNGLDQRAQYWDTDGGPPHPQPLSRKGRGERGYGAVSPEGRREQGAGVVTGCTTTHRVQIFPPLPLRERGWG